MLYGRYVADGTIPLDRTLAQMGIDHRSPLADGELMGAVDRLVAARCRGPKSPSRPSSAIPAVPNYGHNDADSGSGSIS